MASRAARPAKAHLDQTASPMTLPERLAQSISSWTGSTFGFLVAFLSVLLWAALGPVFHYSEDWQLVINTSTTIVTFLMVFLIQRAQNKEALSMQLKLSEIVAALQGASNRLVNVEDLSEQELERIKARYQTLVENTKRRADRKSSHSIEDAVLPGENEPRSAKDRASDEPSLGSQPRTKKGRG